jgi:hypothetical protein
MNWHGSIESMTQSKAKRTARAPRRAAPPEDCPAPREIPSPPNKRRRAVHVPRNVNDSMTFMRGPRPWNQHPSASFCSRQVQRETVMRQQTKREMVMIALSTLAAMPVVAGLGFVVVSGIVAW